MGDPRIVQRDRDRPFSTLRELAIGGDNPVTTGAHDRFAGFKDFREDDGWRAAGGAFKIIHHLARLRRFGPRDTTQRSMGDHSGKGTGPGRVGRVSPRTMGGDHRGFI